MEPDKVLSRREVQNQYDFKGKLEDHVKAPTSFEITELKGLAFDYRTTRIKYSCWLSEDKWSWAAPEIDSINFYDGTKDTKALFTRLRDSGFSSPLITHFAECEKLGTNLTDPEFSDVLMNRVACVHNLDGISVTTHYYRLNGGKLVFQRIHALDASFWKLMVEASHKDPDLEVIELHLAADCDHDLMSFVSSGIQKGHYITKNLKLTGIYTLGGKKLKGGLGKRSKNFQTLKDKDFRIHTLYCGSTRYEPLSVAFYDKRLEQIERKDSLADCAIRVEIRLAFACIEESYKNLFNSLLNSYNHPKGVEFRCGFFWTFIGYGFLISALAIVLKKENFFLYDGKIFYTREFGF